MKKLLVVFLFFSLFKPVSAIEIDNNVCILKSIDEMNEEEKKYCSEYLNNLSNQLPNLNKQLSEIEKQREEISKNIKKYTLEIRNYDSQINTLKKDIDSLNADISKIETEIGEKEKEIDNKQKEIDELKAKLKERMVVSQRTMRINPFLDVIMGSKDFNDLIRRSRVINDILNHDNQTLKEIQALIEELDKVKAALEVSKAELDTKKQDIINKQNEIIIKRREVEIIRQEYMKQEAELEAQGNKIAGDLANIQNKMKEIADNLNTIAVSSGFIRPVSGGYISAGTWHYPESFGGGVHLGTDFAVSMGSNIFAAGNGVILKSADGCPSTGYLGSACAGSGGTTGGGNQIYLLTNVNGILYAVKYLHLQNGSPIATGSIVNSGDVIGKVGSSGNSSGAHVHVEVFYLGAKNLTEYAQSWNGDLSFGAGWGAAALNKTCESGAGAPCRMRPEAVFGG